MSVSSLPPTAILRYPCLCPCTFFFSFIYTTSYVAWFLCVHLVLRSTSVHFMSLPLPEGQIWMLHDCDVKADAATVKCMTGASCISCRHPTVTILLYEGDTKPGYIATIQSFGLCVCCPAFFLFSHITDKHGADEGFRYLHFILASRIVFSAHGADKRRLELTALNESDSGGGANAVAIGVPIWPRLWKRVSSRSNTSKEISGMRLSNSSPVNSRSHPVVGCRQTAFYGSFISLWVPLISMGRPRCFAAGVFSLAWDNMTALSSSW